MANALFVMRAALVFGIVTYCSLILKSSVCIDYGSALKDDGSWIRPAQNRSDPIRNPQNSRETDTESKGVNKRSSVASKSNDNRNPFPYVPLSSTRIAVFYNVFVPLDGQQRARNIMQEQLAFINNSSLTRNGPVSVYYNTIGAYLDDFNTTTICESTKQLQCTHLHHYNVGTYEDVTLGRMHEFCAAHAQYKVVYVHSKGSFHGIETKTLSQSAWRQHMMAAVVHEDCLRNRSADTYCDVCGLLALPLPSVHFPGNFFTAECSYVNKLLHPTVFQQRLQQVVEQAMRKRLDQVFVSNVLKEANYYYGLDRFASEHWIASHPSVRACDMSKRPDLFYWRRAHPPKNVREELEWSAFPRHAITAPWTYIPKDFQVMLNQRSNRMREWFLLSGFLYKWYELYDEAPPNDSWVWTWFPDGPEWKLAVSKYGRNVTDIMAAEFIGKG
jgi:hypothetical protein